MKLTMAVAICWGLNFLGPLVVNAAPSIITQPEPQTVPVGYPAYFAVESSGVAPLGYSWYSNGVPIGAANTNFYFTPPVTPGENGAVYTVVVTDSSGSTNSGSNGVLSVLAAVPSVFTLLPFYSCSVNYYVATNGNDTYTAAQAQNTNTPWRTITNALTVLKNQGGTHGGVCVNVGDGVYPEVVNNSGGGFSIGGSSDTSNGYFVLRSQNPHGATIAVPGNASDNNSHAIWFANAQYVIIDGFVLVGDHSQANVDGAGIKITGTNLSVCSSHHYRLYNNVIYGFGGPAIHGVHVDYVEQRNNVCFSSAATLATGSSGIDYYQPVALDSGAWDTVPANDAGFHIIIADNISFNNFECNFRNTHFDGNGIICDDFNCTQTNNEPGITGYTNRTLVEGNLVFDNGGAGVALGGGCTCYATIRNNTCFNNYGDDNITASWRAEVKITGSPGSLAGVQSSDNNTVMNNIARAKIGTGAHTRFNAAIADVSSGAENTNNNYLNNLTYNGTSGQASLTLQNTTATVTSANGNILGTNPQFTSETNFDFTLQSSSRAIDASTSVSGLPLFDLIGVKRPQGAAVDLGAYEYGYSLLITAIAQLGSNMLITFSMGPGATNALQATSGGGIGSNQTFTDVFVVPSNIYAGAVTNYLDVGVVTNLSSRFYRVRLAPR